MVLHALKQPLSYLQGLIVIQIVWTNLRKKICSDKTTKEELMKKLFFYKCVAHLEHSASYKMRVLKTIT